MTTSKTASNRQSGKHQLDEQRERILDAAEKLFLLHGLDQTRMIDIATESGITKMTLYRYFPDLDTIAFQIHRRMSQKIVSTIVLDPGDLEISLENAKKASQRLIRNFHELRDAYRYLGMFDAIYLDRFTDADVPHQTIDKLNVVMPISPVSMESAISSSPDGVRFNMIISAVNWFLQKSAMRDDMNWHNDHADLDTHLAAFEDMIMIYIQHSMQESPAAPNQQSSEINE
jgi:AcrR family transcriptional regulator